MRIHCIVPGSKTSVVSVETNTVSEGATPYSSVYVQYINVTSGSKAHSFCLLKHATNDEFEINELLDLIPDKELSINWLKVKHPFIQQRLPDGALLKAEDVIYAIARARNSFSGKHEYIDGIKDATHLVNYLVNVLTPVKTVEEECRLMAKVIVRKDGKLYLTVGGSEPSGAHGPLSYIAGYQNDEGAFVIEATSKDSMVDAVIKLKEKIKRNGFDLGAGKK